MIVYSYINITEQKMFDNVVHTKDRWRIEKIDEEFVIFNCQGEEVDSSTDFEEAYSLMDKYILNFKDA